MIRGTPSMPISKDKASAKKPRRVSRSHAPGDKSNLFGTVKLAGGSVCHFGMETWSEKRVILLPHTPNLNYSPHKGLLCAKILLQNKQLNIKQVFS